MLLDRIRDPTAGVASRDDVAALEASIRENVRRILATRQGCAKGVPDYGLPDLDDVIQDPDLAARALVERVAAVIERYEPRVTDVTVRRCTEDEPGFVALAVCLEIKARLIGDPNRRRTRLRANVTGDGRVQVLGDAP